MFSLATVLVVEENVKSIMHANRILRNVLFFAHSFEKG